MIDLGESEKITAVLKLVLIFFTMGRSNFDFLINIQRGAFGAFSGMLTFFLTLQSIKNSFRVAVYIRHIFKFYASNSTIPIPLSTV